MKKEYIEQPIKGIWTRSVLIDPEERLKPNLREREILCTMTRQGNAALVVSPNIRFNSIKSQKVILDETDIENIDEKDDIKLPISEDCECGKQKTLSRRK